MTFGPQRRHVVASIATLVHTLALQQQLLSPNILVLVGRILSQIQINAASTLHPDKSLAVISLFVLAVNAAAVLLHLLAFATETQQGTSILLDFVGQAKHVSKLHLFALDAAISVMQLLSVAVSYLSIHQHQAHSIAFPYPDPLLPSTRRPDSRDQRLAALHEGYLIDEYEETLPKDHRYVDTAFPPMVLSVSLSQLCRLIVLYPSPRPNQLPGSLEAHQAPVNTILSTLEPSTDSVLRPPVGERIPGQWVPGQWVAAT